MEWQCYQSQSCEEGYVISQRHAQLPLLTNDWIMRCFQWPRNPNARKLATDLFRGGCGVPTSHSTSA